MPLPSWRILDAVRVRPGAVAYLDGANVGYPIGLKPRWSPRQVNRFLGRPAAAPSPPRAGERVEVNVEDLQVVEGDGELRVALTQEAMAAAGGPCVGSVPGSGGLPIGSRRAA